MKKIFFFINFFFCLNSNVKVFEFCTQLFEFELVKTEYLAWQILKRTNFEKNLNYVAIPWAALLNTQQLDLIPNIQINNGVTVCQHIYYEKLIPILKKIGVKILFTPHVNKDYSDIIVLPFPHYAVNGIESSLTKDILYSFVGFDTHWTRKEIFKLPRSENIFIKERKEWHFKTSLNPSVIKRKKEEKKEYQDILSRSRFSLCPRGTGSSTLRFWESLQAGAIPILISDDMRLPSGIKWENCVIKIKENKIKEINKVISHLSLEKEEFMRENCLKVYKEFSGENFIQCILKYYNSIQ